MCFFSNLYLILEYSWFSYTYTYWIKFRNRGRCILHPPFSPLSFIFKHSGLSHYLPILTKPAFRKVLGTCHVHVDMNPIHCSPSQVSWWDLVWIISFCFVVRLFGHQTSKIMPMGLRCKAGWCDLLRRQQLRH